jgi:KDO2-lipid IV(A) lauroyltransferase
VLTDLALRLLNRLAADTACRVGGGLGVLAWRLGVRRRVAAQQLTACLGVRGPARARILRRAYASMGAQFLQIWTIGGPASPVEAVRFLNPGWVAHLTRRHRGIVFLTGHLGDWDMGAHAMARQRDELLVYAKAQHNPALDARLNAQRAKAGLRVVLVQPSDRSSAVQALKALRRGAALGMLADQKPSGGTPAWFLGQPARCHDGPAFFARKAGVPIIPGFSVRIAAGRSVVFVGRPFLAGADHAADVQRIMDQLSAMIAAFPGQYFWMHRRFRPEDAPPLPGRPDEPWRGRGLRLLVDAAPAQAGQQHQGGAEHAGAAAAGAAVVVA